MSPGDPTGFFRRRRVRRRTDVRSPVADAFAKALSHAPSSRVLNVKQETVRPSWIGRLVRAIQRRLAISRPGKP
jgi:hypothetical protein